MKRLAKLMILLSVAPLLMAAIWMDKQPSPKPYQAPALLPPGDSVPVTGRETLTQDSLPRNPLSPADASPQQGKELFAVNCAFCHGHNSAERGPVGKKLNPPPPGLDRALLNERSDAQIYKAISLGFGRMPPFKDKLTQRERWQLVIFLRSRN